MQRKQRKRRKQRFFWGYCRELGDCRELSNNLAGDEKGWANVTTQKILCFPCSLCISRF